MIEKKSGSNAIRNICIVLVLLAVATSPMSKPAAYSDPIHRTIQTAFRLTDSLTEQLIRNWLFTLVLSERQEFAYTFAKQTGSPVLRFQAYLFIADAFRKIGKIDNAQNALEKASLTVKQISSPDKQFSALAKLAVEQGNIDEAFKQTGAIGNELMRDQTWSAIGLRLIQVGQFDAAVKVAQKDMFSGARLEFLLQMVQELLTSGQRERAKTIAQEALVFARELQGSGADSLERFASAITRAGLSYELLEQFQRFNKNLYIREQAFEAIAIGLVEAGDTAKALEVARGITSATRDGEARALAAVSQALRERGRIDEAEKILTESLDIAIKIGFPAHRSWALHKIAPMLVRAGRIDEALKAVRSLGFIDNEPMAFVAVALGESGNLDLAIQVAKEAFASPGNFEYRITSGALHGVVRALHNAGRENDARQFVQLAHSRLANIKEPISKSASCRSVAETLALMGQWEQAIALVERCDQEIDKIAACTAIVREYSITQNPSLTDRFKKVMG
jgi:tetratricopeptide (TPR) repeat protein